MTKTHLFTLLSVLLLAAAPSAEARKNPGNTLAAPNLVNAAVLDAGAAECDGDELTTDDVCVEVTFTKVCEASKYSVDVTNGFDTDTDGCDDQWIKSDGTIVAEACTGTLNCLIGTAECQTGVVPIGQTTLCVDDGDLTVDCVNDLEDVLVSKDSTCAKVKGLNPPKPGKNAISQSTLFSNTLCPDVNDECQ